MDRHGEKADKELDIALKRLVSYALYACAFHPMRYKSSQ